MTDSELQEEANTVVSAKEVSVCRKCKQPSCMRVSSSHWKTDHDGRLLENVKTLLQTLDCNEKRELAARMTFDEVVIQNRIVEQSEELMR
jgi:hypothetical protein